MSKIWFTADQHFGHTNIIGFCDRPFAGASHMDAVLIDNWNQVVDHDDLVYVLGDFTLRGARAAQGYIERLAGRIVFLPGSHDRWLEQQVTRYDGDVFTRCKIAPPIKEIKVTGQHIVLCHYAMRSWARSIHGSYQLYGHSHGRLEDTRLPRQMDVGVDLHNFYPVSLDEVLVTLREDIEAPVD